MNLFKYISIHETILGGTSGGTLYISHHETLLGGTSGGTLLQKKWWHLGGTFRKVVAL